MLKISKYVNKSILEFYERWLEYIPESWNIDELLDKKASDLSEEELNLLTIIKEDKKSNDILKKYIKMVEEKQGANSRDLCNLTLTASEFTELNEVLSAFDLEKIALIKLSENELNNINNIIDLFDGTNKEDVYENINNLESIYMRDYAGYLLKMKIADYTTKEFADKMKKGHRGYKVRRRTNPNRRKKY